MSSRTEKERTKQIHEKCQRLLNEMLKDDDNKYCVDCDAKGPRWASWNIGIFLCIRCAGIHRKLGVHISRVKSVNLDTWTPQQVVSLQQMGNSRARAVYEANLPDNFRRPQSDGSLETFIRAKYEQKKYIAREWVPPALPKVNWDKELEEEAEKQKKKKREGIQSNLTSIRPIAAPPVIPQPLPKPQTSSPKINRTSTQNTTDLLGLSTPTKENNKNSTDSDLFANFLNASVETNSNVSTDSINTSTIVTSTSRSEEEENFFNQSVSSTSGKQKQLTTDSILALYGNPTRNMGGGQIGAGPGSNVFSSPAALNCAMNSFPKQAVMSQPTLQNDLMQTGISFPNNMASSSANLAFVSNPFYSMAASGVQSGFPVSKGFSNFTSTNNNNNNNNNININNMVEFDSQQNQFTQQMEGLNLNGQPNQFSFPQTNAFDVTTDNAKIQHQPATNFGQSVPATHFWE